MVSSLSNLVNNVAEGIHNINPKTAGGGSVLAPPPPCGFSKNVSSRERVEPSFLVTFNIKTHLS